MKLSTRINLNYALTSIMLLVLSFITLNFKAEAAICQVGEISWQCVDDKKIIISDETGSFEGNKPEIELSLQYRLKNTDPYVPFLAGSLPENFKFDSNMQWRVNYKLKDGLAQALTDGGVKPLPEGKFDKDGDPIDNQKVYESIQWYVHQPNQLPTEEDLIKLAHPFDEFSLTKDTCKNGYTISVSAIAFTYTGVPNQGDTGYLNILGNGGTPLILDNCEAIDIFNQDIFVVITNQKGVFLINQTDPSSIPNTEANPGDKLTAKFFVKDLMRKEENAFIEVTDKVLPTVVWGYYIQEGDDIHGDGTLSKVREEIWMDGSQPTSEQVPKDFRNTTGMQTFQIQEDNNDARALQGENHSEQAMRVILKFGVTQ